MPLDPQQEQALLHQGLAALQQGRAGEARSRLEQLTRAGSVNPLAWLLLAIACRGVKDAAAEEAAVDRLLQIDGTSTRGQSLGDVVMRVRGRVGTQVNLTVERGKTRMVVVLRRREMVKDAQDYVGKQ